MTLSCSECDNRIGHDYDRHISQEKRHIERVEAKRGIPCKMRWITENKNYAILLDIHRPESDQLEVHIKPSKNIPPRIWSEYISRPGNWHNGIQIKMTLFSPERRNLSHIYSSFLLMFSRLGYEYALSPNIDTICQALTESHLTLKTSQLVMDLPKPPFQVPIPSICMMIEPVEMCAFAILMPSPIKGRIRYVFLPGFGKTGENGYHNLLDQVGTHSIIEATIARFPLNKSISDINNEEVKYYGTSIWDALIERIQSVQN